MYFIHDVFKTMSLILRATMAIRVYIVLINNQRQKQQYHWNKKKHHKKFSFYARVTEYSKVLRIN